MNGIIIFFSLVVILLLLYGKNGKTETDPLSGLVEDNQLRHYELENSKILSKDLETSISNTKIVI